MIKFEVEFHKLLQVANQNKLEGLDDIDINVRLNLSSNVCPKDK